jgi:hypothetical protein
MSKKNRFTLTAEHELETKIIGHYTRKSDALRRVNKMSKYVEENEAAILKSLDEGAEWPWMKAWPEGHAAVLRDNHTGNVFVDEGEGWKLVHDEFRETSEAEMKMIKKEQRV